MILETCLESVNQMKTVFNQHIAALISPVLILEYVCMEENSKWTRVTTTLSVCHDVVPITNALTFWNVTKSVGQIQSVRTLTPPVAQKGIALLA